MSSSFSPYTSAQFFQTTSFDGAEAYSGLEYQYTADGHREVAIEARGSASVTLERYRIQAQDARGNVTELAKGGVTVTKHFADDTGRIESIFSQSLTLATIQDLAFEFDVLVNLTNKQDLRRAGTDNLTRANC